MYRKLSDKIYDFTVNAVILSEARFFAKDDGQIKKGGIMELAMVGLGRMGLNMAARLLKGNHRVIAYDLFETAIQKAEASGAEGAPETFSFPS